MKRLLAFSILLSTIAFTACSKHSLRGEGSIISDTRSLPDFTTIQADGSIEVEVYPSSTNSVVVTGYQNLVPAFETNVNGSSLSLKYKEKYVNIRHNNIKVTVYSTSANKVSMNGSGTIRIKQGMKAPSMDASINGSGQVYVDDNKFEIVKYKVNGSGDIYARPATAQTAYVTISGSGDVELTVTKYLETHISGSGDIRYWGNPETVNTDISGSGKVTHN